MRNGALGADDVVMRARVVAAQGAVDAGHPELCDDAALVASELVTNAVLHGGGCVAFDIVAISDGVRVEVQDRSQAPPLLAHASEESLTGRGVRLIATLSARWGVTPRPDG
ncbi:MAG TPA: ATP-binding protein, partial [Acidimicrobiales bacterium]